VGVSGNQTHPGGGPERLQLASAEASAQSDVMAETRVWEREETYFHNNNDADEGFPPDRRRARKYIYVLGFSPEKVGRQVPQAEGHATREKGKSGLGKARGCRARQGYYALKAASGLVRLRTWRLRVL